MAPRRSGAPELWVERRELPALAAGEFYRADLVGFEVVNLAGRTLGRVDHFLDLPANAVMVVSGERDRWVPVGGQQLFRVDVGAAPHHRRLGSRSSTCRSKSSRSFPPLIEAGLAAGVVGRAVTAGVLRVGTENPRSHATDLHRTVDDRPFGGGPGMVLKPEPLAAAIRAIAARLPAGAPVIGPGRAGRDLRPGDGAAAGGTARASGWWPDATRASTSVWPRRLIDEELSIGDYVLSGGELPALVVIDAIARLLPGVLGRRRIRAAGFVRDGLLDWPHYTRPETWEGARCRPVLLGGNHAAIRRWRLMQALGRTWRLRPDLLRDAQLDADERALLEEYCRPGRDRPPR